MIRNEFPELYNIYAQSHTVYGKKPCYHARRSTSGWIQQHSYVIVQAG